MEIKRTAEGVDRKVFLVRKVDRGGGKKILSTRDVDKSRERKGGQTDGENTGEMFRRVPLP